MRPRSTRRIGVWAAAGGLAALALGVVIAHEARTPAPPPPAAVGPKSAAKPKPKPKPTGAPVVIASVRPGFAALPFVIATANKWWEAAGLDPTFEAFPDDAAEAAEAAPKSGRGGWDVATLGAVDGIVGAARSGLLTVGIAEDASAAIGLVARPGEVAAITRDPASLKGKALLVTATSAGEYVALACLAHWHLSPSALDIVEREPGALLGDFAAGIGTLAALPAQARLALVAKGAAQIVCTGKIAGAVVPTALVARGGFAKAHPEIVARVIAVYLRAQLWETTHRGATIALLRDLDRKAGATPSDAMLEAALADHESLSLAAQLALLDRAKDGVSTADGWFGRIAAYVVSTGALRAPPIGESYLTDRYLKWVAGDSRVKAILDADAAKAAVANAPGIKTPGTKPATGTKTATEEKPKPPPSPSGGKPEAAGAKPGEASAKPPDAPPPPASSRPGSPHH